MQKPRMPQRKTKPRNNDTLQTKSNLIVYKGTHPGALFYSQSAEADRAILDYLSKILYGYPLYELAVRSYDETAFLKPTHL
jgi:hypothetical protein